MSTKLSKTDFVSELVIKKSKELDREVYDLAVYFWQKIYFEIGK